MPRNMCDAAQVRARGATVAGDGTTATVVQEPINVAMPPVVQDMPAVMESNNIEVGSLLLSSSPLLGVPPRDPPIDAPELTLNVDTYSQIASPELSPKSSSSSLSPLSSPASTIAPLPEKKSYANAETRDIHTEASLTLPNIAQRKAASAQKLSLNAHQGIRTRRTLIPVYRPLGPRHLEYDYNLAHERFKAAIYGALGTLGYCPPQGRKSAEVDLGHIARQQLGSNIMQRLKKIPTVVVASRVLDATDQALEEALSRGEFWDNTPIPEEYKLANIDVEGLDLRGLFLPQPSTPLQPEPVTQKRGPGRPRKEKLDHPRPTASATARPTTTSFAREKNHASSSRTHSTTENCTIPQSTISKKRKTTGSNMESSLLPPIGDANVHGVPPRAKRTRRAPNQR